MKRILQKNSFSLFNFQKRFEKKEVAPSKGGPRDRVPLYQSQIKYNHRYKAFHRENPSDNLNEKISNMLATQRKEMVPAEHNSVIYFLRKYTDEEIQKKTIEEIEAEIHPDDLFPVVSSLEQDIGEKLYASVMNDILPYVNKLDLDVDHLETFKFEYYIHNAPIGLEETLGVSEKERDELIASFEPENDAPGPLRYGKIPKELRPLFEEVERLEREVNLELVKEESTKNFQDFQLEINRAKRENKINPNDAPEVTKKKLKDFELDDEPEDKEYTNNDIFLTYNKHPKVIRSLVESLIENSREVKDDLAKQEIFEWIESEDCKRMMEDGENQVLDALNRARTIFDDDYVKDNRHPMLEEVSDVASVNAGDKMWQLHKMDPKLWTGDRLGPLFGTSRERAWGEIMVREYEEAMRLGKPFNFDKVSLIMKDAIRRGHRNAEDNSTFKTRYLTEEQAYQDYLRASKSPPTEGGDDVLPDWAALPFQPYRKPEVEPDIKVIEEPKRFDKFGAIGTNSRILYIDYGRGVNNNNREYRVRDVDGTLRTANWAEEKHFFRIGTTVKKLLSGRGNRDKRKLVRRRRAFWSLHY